MASVTRCITTQKGEITTQKTFIDDQFHEPGSMLRT